MKRFSYLFLAGSALALTLLSSAVADTIPIPDNRCDTSGDRLSRAEAVIRVEFALRCETDRRIRYEILRHFKAFGGYPHYAYWDSTREDYTHPNQWLAPPRSHADCPDIPTGYELAFICAPD